MSLQLLDELSCVFSLPHEGQGAHAQDRRELCTRRTGDQLLQKANESIAIRPRKGRLTLLSRRIYNALLYHAQQQGVDERQYSLALTTLVGDAHFNSRNVALLKEHLREMQTTLIEWNSVGPTEQRWTSTQLLGTVEIVERGSGYPVVLYWSYPEKVRERLLKPMRYTRLLLEVGARMRSYAAAVLFELGMQYLTSPARLTMREGLFWWAAVLTGRSDIDTVDYRYFKRDVLRPALAEVNALQEEFTLELLEHKEGRRVAELQFMVHRAARLAEEPPEVRKPPDPALIQRLRSLGLDEADTERIAAQTDEATLCAALEHVERRMRNSNLAPLDSPAAYLHDALKKGYATAAGRAQPAERSHDTPERRQASIEAIRDAWSREQGRRARERFENLPQIDQQALQARFEASGTTDLIASVAGAWQREGPRSRIAGPVFFRWLARQWGEREPTDEELLRFAAERGLATVDENA